MSIIRDCLGALLHPSARYDALTRARHRAFMAPRLLGSLVALAAFPVYLAMRGAPTAIEVAAFAWLIAPILLSWFLSRTGRYDGAHVLSSLAMAGLVMMVAVNTGGIESFAAIWLVVVMLTGLVGLATMTAAVCVPVAIWVLGPAGEPLLSFAIAMAALVVFAHRSNIGRMNAGTEPRMNRLWLLRPRNSGS